MGKLIRFPRRHHARASLNSTASGRGISDGHGRSDGQFAENQRMVRSRRPTLMSAPSSSARSFLLSSSARELTVESGTPSSSPYMRATVRSCSMPDITGISVNLPVLSTAFLPNDPPAGTGYSTGMDLAVVYANIERRLRLLKMSAHKASTLAEAPDAIRNMKRKLKGEIKGDGITAQTLDALARVLNTTAEELKAAPPKPDIRPVAGLRETLLKKIEWLDRERERAMQELAALDDAEQRPQKRKRA